MAIIYIPIELFAQLEAKAQAEGKSVHDLASETLRDSLDKGSIELKAVRFAEKYGKKSGYTPEQVPDLVCEWRNEQRGRELTSANMNSNIKPRFSHLGGEYWVTIFRLQGNSTKLL